MIKESIEMGGVELTIEVGKLAKQAHGSVVVRHGDSLVLGSCCGDENFKNDTRNYTHFNFGRKTYS